MLITNALRYELKFFINQSKSFKIRCELSGLKPAHFVPLVSIFVRFFLVGLVEISSNCLLLSCVDLCNASWNDLCTLKYFVLLLKLAIKTLILYSLPLYLNIFPCINVYDGFNRDISHICAHIIETLCICLLSIAHNFTYRTTCENQRAHDWSTCLDILLWWRHCDVQKSQRKKEYSVV